MKTLDEVIKAFEQCKDDKCYECAYHEKVHADSCITKRKSDALHYLRAFRDAKDTLEREKDKYAEAVKNCERAENIYKQKQKAAEDALWKIASEPNPALTWDELKQMFHRPVWIETTAKKGWNIIVSIDGADMQVIHTAHRGPKLSGFSKADLGVTWNAYRKERP